MNSFRLSMVMALPLLACTASAWADPFDAIPARNPQPLQQLANLDDASFNRLVSENGGAAFRQMITPYDPGDTPIFPLSHGFDGARKACLVQRNPVACRLYTVDLLNIQLEKQNRGAVPVSAPAQPAQ
jgi:hypothetical protein